MGRAYWLGKLGPVDDFGAAYKDIMIEGKTTHGNWAIMVERLARRSVYFFRDCFDAPENLIFERIEVARDRAWRFGYATSFNGIHTANS